MADWHSILDGKVNLYKRAGSPLWQCSTYLAGKERRKSSKEENLIRAEAFAENWYLELRGKLASGTISGEKTFKDAAKKFTLEYEVMTEGERNAKYVADHQSRLRNHLIPHFGHMGLSEITAGAAQDYRVYRASGKGGWKSPSRSTMHKEIVTLRLVLKTAIRHKWLAGLPDLTMPYRASGKVTHRAWFSPDEYKSLYTATRENVQQSKGRPWHVHALDLHDEVLFMANTGIRPDEANCLQRRDVIIVDDEGTGETILEIEVRGKRGVGYCKSMPGAVRPFERLVERHRYGPTDLLFPNDHKKQFNRVLNELGLKFDRDGQSRSLYSLRHSYISFRLLEGADIYQVAKNCRTSVEMIEKHYATHLKDNLDASAINVRKVRR